MEGRENILEREAKPHKRFLFIRHPSQQMFDSLVDRLQQSPTNTDVLIAHRLTIAVAIWLSEHPEKRADDYELNVDDLSEIFQNSGRLPFSSISEIEIVNDEFSVKEVGATHHL